MPDSRRGDRHKPDRRLLSCRIPVAQYDALAAAAEDRDVSMAWLVSRALDEFLPRLVPVDQFTLTRDRAADTDA